MSTSGAHASAPAPLRWSTIEVEGRPAVSGEAGAGPPVVFLHGWGLAATTYRRALDALCRRGVHVLAPALPGFGGTAALPADAFSLAGYAAWVDAYLEAVGVAKPVVLMGHSFGGGVAIRAAHDFPARARGLVLVNSIGGSAWRAQGSVVRSMAERPLWDWGLHLSRDLAPWRQLRHVVPVIARDGIPNLLRDPRGFWRSATLARNADLRPELEELRRREVPIVVLWGAQDRVVTRASFEAMCEAVGGEDCHAVPGSHSWLIADPEGFGEIVTNVVGAARRIGGDDVAELREPIGDRGGSSRVGPPRGRSERRRRSGS